MEEDVIQELYENIEAEKALRELLLSEHEKAKISNGKGIPFSYNRYDFEFKNDIVEFSDDVYFDKTGIIQIDIGNLMERCYKP